MFKSFIVVIQNLEQIHRLKQLDKILRISEHDWELIIVSSNVDIETEQQVHELMQKGDILNSRFLSIASYGNNLLDPSWAGVQAAIGDRLVLVDLSEEAVKAVKGLSARAEVYDAYFGFYGKKERTSAKRLFSSLFGAVYRFSTGSNFRSGQAAYVEMSKTFVNFVSSSPNPEITLRNASIIRGFNSGIEELDARPNRVDKVKKSGSFDRASEILFTASKSPMRFISYVAVAGALLNLLYSVYVIITGITQEVEAGWTSLSLQISGMFFIFSLVLAAISEFLIILSKNQSAGNGFFVREETSSANIGLASKLNVKDKTVDDKNNE